MFRCYDILELYDVLVLPRFAKSKTKLDISYKKLDGSVASCVVERINT